MLDVRTRRRKDKRWIERKKEGMKGHNEDMKETKQKQRK